MRGPSVSPASPQAAGARVPASPQVRPGTQGDRRPTLTAKNLLSLPEGDWTDRTVAGLTLRVRPAGRWWELRYRARQGAGRGPQRRLRFGMVGGPVALDLAALDLAGFETPKALTLETARDVARALLGLAARGLDPLELLENCDRERREREAEAERRRSAGVVTLGALLDRYLAYRSNPPKGDRERAIRPSTLAGWQSLRRSALAPLLHLDPATLTAREVKRWHERMGGERGQVIANRALELLSVLYAWAMRTEDEAGEPLLAATPCVGVKPFLERARSRVLDSAELRAVWCALEGEFYGDVLRLLLWTGARKSEATGAEWREVDFRAKLWTVPAERSKTGEVRRIPLSLPAVAMLRNRREASPAARWIFPSPVGAVGPLGSPQAVVRRAQSRSGVDGWTVHDLRRVVRSGLSALGVSPTVAEFILGHLPPKMTRTYDRHEPLAEAAAALEAWARRLESYVHPGEGGADVLPFVMGAEQ